MEEDIRKQFFPMKLPCGVVGRSMGENAAQEAIGIINHLIFPPGFKRALGLFEAPETRGDRFGALQKMPTHAHREWIVFYHGDDEPIGWFYGYGEDAETFFIDTIGLIPKFRGQGIYTDFLRQLVNCMRATGYERLTTSHHPNNRPALIADLKAGFVIVGLELNEGHGPLVKMACPLYEDRRRGLERVFSMDRESARGTDQKAGDG